jgi:hypothetical protein
VTPKTCGADDENAQMILLWVRAPGVGNAFHPRRLRVKRVSHKLCVIHGVRILECSKTLQSEVKAKRCANLNEAMSRDSALDNNGLGVAPETAKI